jgi:hypothetical protein
MRVFAIPNSKTMKENVDKQLLQFIKKGVI